MFEVINTQVEICQKLVKSKQKTSLRTIDWTLLKGLLNLLVPHTKFVSPHGKKIKGKEQPTKKKVQSKAALKASFY